MIQVLDRPTQQVELTARDMTLIQGAVSMEIRYVLGLLKKGKDAEAIGRNQVNLLEWRLLAEKLKQYDSEPFHITERTRGGAA